MSSVTYFATPITTPALDRARAAMDTRGLCAAHGVDDERWMPEVPDHPHASFADLLAVEARSACRGCPVMSECLTWAVDTQQRWGVWGGHAQHEIRAMVRESATTTAAAVAA